MSGIRFGYLEHLAHHYAICISEKAFAKHIRRMGCPSTQFILPNSNASTHHFVDENGKGCSIVCIEPPGDRVARVVDALIIHEGVHVWQEVCYQIGERNPGREMEAYHIQRITLDLLTWYDEMCR